MKSILVFDLDDTLFPERQYVESGFRAISHWLQDAHEIIGFFDVAWKLFEAGTRGRIFNQALKHLGRPADDALVKQLVEVYRNHSPSISLFPDASWALKHFTSSHRLALLTDGFAVSQRRKIEALGIEGVFETIIVTDELGREFWKPHPRAYEQVVQRLKCTHEICTYVGDNPRKDFVTARKLGWRTVRVLRENGEHSAYVALAGESADQSITSLRQLQA